MTSGPANSGFSASDLGPGGGGDRVLHSVMVGLDLLVIVNRCIYICIYNIHIDILLNVS